MIKYFHRNS